MSVLAAYSVGRDGASCGRVADIGKFRRGQTDGKLCAAAEVFGDNGGECGWYCRCCWGYARVESSR